MKLMTVIGLLVMTLGSACSENVVQERNTPTSPAPRDSSPAAQRGKEPFDRLTMALELNANEVATGGTLGSRVTVENETKKPVVDPGCLLYAYSFALVPVDDPEAELWGQIVVDCSGPVTLSPGYSDTYDGPTFRATDKYGDPLPVGDYLAVMSLEKRSERFVQPVTITE